MNARVPVSSPCSLERDGFELHLGVLSSREIEALVCDITDGIDDASPNRRNLLRDNASVARVAASAPLNGIADHALGAAAFPVRVILFDKVDGANWSVPWHQDLAIPVREKVDAPGFGGWSVKEGVPHVLPPAEVLAGMVTLRLHLDDCGEANGPLRVLPGSHRFGKLSEAEIARVRGKTPEVTCLATRGSVLAMRPLLLHASSAAQRPGHRRVLHIEYAAHRLPSGLRWPALPTIHP